MRNGLDLLRQLSRYVTVGLLNTAFSYALYAVLIGIGLHMFAAQLVGTVIAVIFNYGTYSRHVFGAPASKLRFIGSYAVNYVVSLASLAVAASFVASPYIAGLWAIAFAAGVNFIVLKRFVFLGQAGAAHA